MQNVAASVTAGVTMFAKVTGADRLTPNGQMLYEARLFLLARTKPRARADPLAFS
jgi:hypothetical protein